MRSSAWPTRARRRGARRSRRRSAPARSVAMRGGTTSRPASASSRSYSPSPCSAAARGVARSASARGRWPMNVLELRDLCVTYRSDRGHVPTVRGVDLSIAPGETVGLAGESGCGKSTIAATVLRLLPGDALVEGEVLLNGEDVYAMKPGRLRAVRWTAAAIVFQGALHSLNPVRRVGEQIQEAMLIHTDRGATGKQAITDRVLELLERVGLRADLARSYPHQDVGRSTPACAHRPRAGVRTRPVDRRRADRCARRDGAGPGVGTAGRVPARSRAGAVVHHPRPLGAQQHV